MDTALTGCCEENNRGACRQAQKQVSDNLQKIDVDFTLCKISPRISLEIIFNTTKYQKTRNYHFRTYSPVQT